jgi:hypothetical protein
VYHPDYPGDERSVVRLPQEQLKRLAGSKERRRFRRVRVDLPGRFMLTDGREHPCQVLDISAGGMKLATPIMGLVGERVVAYVDHIGRLEGVIARVYPKGFAVEITATLRKRESLAAVLTLLATGQIDHRQHARMIPRNPHTTMVLPDGTSVSCRLLNVSLSGAAVTSDTKPPLGTLIRLGAAQGRVVRVSNDSFAVEFTQLQPPDFFEQNAAEQSSTSCPSTD